MASHGRVKIPYSGKFSLVQIFVKVPFSEEIFAVLIFAFSASY